MKTIAIASGKGGTGKTTVSVNLARYLSTRQEVILADLDVEEPNAALFLGVTTEEVEAVHRLVPRWDSVTCTRCGKCQDVCAFNAVQLIGSEVMVLPQLCHSCTACSRLCPEGSLPLAEQHIGTLVGGSADRLSFFEGTLDIGEEQAVPLIKRVKEKVEARAAGGSPVAILDSPPGTACPMIEAVKDADFVFLVTEPTPFGLHDLKLAVETLRQLGQPFAVIINRSGIGDDGVERYCDAEDIDIAASFPESRAIAEAYARGRVVYEDDPGFAGELEKLAEWIGGISERKS